MAFTGDDFHDLVRLLDERPEWRAEVRRLIFSDDVLAVPDQIAELRLDVQRLEAQIAEQRLDTQRLETQIAEQRLDTQRLETQIAEQRQDTQRLETQIAEQRLDTQRLEAQIAEQRQDTQRLETQITEQRQEHEQRFERIETQIAEQRQDIQRLEAQITEQRQEHEQRFERIEAQIAEQRQDIQRLEAQIARLRSDTERRFRQVEDQIAALVRTVDTIKNDVGDLKGDSLERRYRERGAAYFGRMVRRGHVLTDDEVVKMLDAALAREMLTEDECDEVIWADVIVRGRRRDDGTEVVLVVEVSWGVGVRDVERALRRADLVARLGHATLPVVGGKAVTREAAELAQDRGVWQLYDGKVVPPDNGAPRA